MDIEAFPYPGALTRADFADQGDFDADSFLYLQHRFTLLEALLLDLRTLLRTLKKDLSDLVDSEYASFIQLGQLILGLLELIHSVQADVSGYSGVLENVGASLHESSAAVERALAHKQRLNLLKNRAKLTILFSEQCELFERLLSVTDQDPAKMERQLLTLTTLYLLLMNIVATLVEHKQCVYFDKFVQPKAASLRMEFRAYLDQMFAKAKEQSLSGVLMHVLRIFEITRAGRGDSR